jgi:COP9 signalosome complex subunit 2
MSDEDEYEYEYDDEDEEMGGGGEESNNFEYTDEEDEQDDAEVALENAYYNAKGLRETSVAEAAAAFEQVIVQEKQASNSYGPWSYKAMKQLIKLHLRHTNRDGDEETIMNQYRRLLECISTGGSDIGPATIEKGINSMLERVASLYNSSSATSSFSGSKEDTINDATPTNDTFSPQKLALAVYEATLTVFHPKSGTVPNERLWFKTNLKYGQLLCEMGETARLQTVLHELLQVHGGEPEGGGGSTNSMEICALQIQLYSRQKDNKKLRETFHRAMNVRGGIPHPRTIALIQGMLK